MYHHMHVASYSDQVETRPPSAYEQQIAPPHKHLLQHASAICDHLPVHMLPKCTSTIQAVMLGTSVDTIECVHGNKLSGLLV